MNDSPKLVNAQLNPLTSLDREMLLFVNMVSSFLEIGDNLLEFNINGCVSSSFFNELNIAEHKVVAEAVKDSSYHGSTACASNKKETKSSFSLELDPSLQTLLDFDPTALVLGFSARKETQDMFLELCKASKNLRLVIYESDIDTKDEFIASVFSVLKENFHPHVTGKFTVLVKGDAPKNIRKLNRSARPLQAILAIAFIVFFVLFVMWLRSTFLKF